MFTSIDIDTFGLSADELLRKLGRKNKKVLITPNDIRKIVKPEDWHRFGINEIGINEK